MEENKLINRRELLIKSLRAGAGLGLGALALGTFGDLSPLSSRAANNLTEGD